MKGSKFLLRALSLALMLLLAALTAMPALAASNDNPGGAYVVTTYKGNLYLHGSANYSDVIGKLPKNAVVVYKGQSKGWWKVQYAKGTGYVDRRYLTSVDAYIGAKFAPVCNLYVRLKPSVSSWSVGKMRKGLKVTLLKQKGTWMYVEYKGSKGWVASKYMRKA